MSIDVTVAHRHVLRRNKLYAIRRRTSPPSPWATSPLSISAALPQKAGLDDRCIGPTASDSMIGAKPSPERSDHSSAQGMSAQQMLAVSLLLGRAARLERQAFRSNTMID
jgi:hypothetical protein